MRIKNSAFITILILLIAASTSYANDFFLGTEQGVLIPVSDWSNTYNTGGFIIPKFGYTISEKIALVTEGMVGFQGIADRIIERYKRDYGIENVDITTRIGALNLNVRYRFQNMRNFNPNMEIGYGIYFYDLSTEIESLNITEYYVDNSWGNGFNLGLGVHYHFGETRKNSVQFYMRYFHNFQQAEFYYRNLDGTTDIEDIGSPVNGFLVGVGWELGGLH